MGECIVQDIPKYTQQKEVTLLVNEIMNWFS